jgi:hypothetical protein
MDPLDFRRVWALTRGADTAGRASSSMKRSFKVPAQAVSVTFNKEGKVTKFTMGHLIDKSQNQKTRTKKRPNVLTALGSSLGKVTSGLTSLFAAK